MENRVARILKERQETKIKGLYCACTANEFVIASCLLKAKQTKTPIIIEATANQVNQHGGYTAMQPADYVAFIKRIAAEVVYPYSDIILGGDHLGPLTWSHLDEAEAMKEAKELVRLFVLAGFTKLHLDTSMRLKSDDPAVPLATETIAKRGAELARVCEAAYQELLTKDPNAEAPCYIIGSEVPIPGGEQEDTGIKVTGAADFKDTVRIYQDVFSEQGLSEAFKRVVAVVVQPGVEFGDETIHEYNPQAVLELKEALQDYPDFVFEGHSTDYQTVEKLREMIDDNVALLKVGPGLTFAYREGLFALAKIEEELFNGIKPLSKLIETIEEIMLEKPDNWKKYYHGSAKKQELARKYSFSDRVRYYFPENSVKNSILLLFDNFNDTIIPLTLLSQYMPAQHKKVRANQLENDATSLVRDFIYNSIDAYLGAIVR